MTKDNIVVLRDNEVIEFKTDTLHPHQYYRHLQESNGKTKQHLIYGIVFSHYRYKALFEPVVERVRRDWLDMGLLTKDGKAISKSAFVKLADIHTFTGWNGRRVKKLVWYFRNSRERIYGFYPVAESKKASTDECYQYYLDIVNGSDDQLDPAYGRVCFGNCGIPLSYSRLRIS